MTVAFPQHRTTTTDRCYIIFEEEKGLTYFRIAESVKFEILVANKTRTEESDISLRNPKRKGSMCEKWETFLNLIR